MACSLEYCKVLYRTNYCPFALFQFNPQLILISAGYDAALGCPEVTTVHIPARCLIFKIGELVKEFLQGRQEEYTESM